MLINICEQLQFPKESIELLVDVRNSIAAQQGAETLLQRVSECLCEPCGEDPLQQISQLSQETGFHQYTVAMIAFLCAIPLLREKYRQNGLSEQLFWDSMMDLTFKLEECKKIEGIWGTMAAAWHTRFYQLQLFKLGRLEYEKILYRWDTSYAGVTKGDPVVNIHIPSCGRLSMAAVKESLKCAFAFYKDAFPNDRIPFVCSSWLLYPPIYKLVFPQGSNLQSFFRCFHILEEKVDLQNKDFWRICDQKYTDGILERIVPKTTLQQNLVIYLKNGGRMGIGKGIFFFDGETITHDESVPVDL